MMERACLYDANGNPVESEGVCNWEDLGITIVLTGPVPITNAVTEFSFKLFWDIFPKAVVLVAIGLFVFHSDLLQAGLTGIRPLQGFKVIVIAGLPTLCAVFWTLGLIGSKNYEVTMTVIIVGPIYCVGCIVRVTHNQSLRGRRRYQERENAGIIEFYWACRFPFCCNHGDRFHLSCVYADGAHPNGGYCPFWWYCHRLLPHDVHGSKFNPDFGPKKAKTSSPQGL